MRRKTLSAALSADIKYARVTAVTSSYNFTVVTIVTHVSGLQVINGGHCLCV